MKTIQQRMEDVAERIHEVGLSRIADPLQRLLRPSVRLTVESASSDAATRLGGTPNLPADIPWPSQEDGRPFSFIAQVNLSQLEPVDDLPLPRLGSLFFFYDTVEQPWGFDPKNNNGFKVVYSTTNLISNALRRQPDGLDEGSLFKGFSLLPKTEITAPGWNHAALESLHLSQAESDAYSELFHPEGIIHRIGGYADEIQGSLTLEAELVSNGIYCGNPKGYEEAKRRGLGPGAADWRLLLQIDSEEDAGMMWGDVGRIYFQIREQDVKDLKFDRVHVALQCG
jgi:uncharacterized protein YwqG